ncbi:hypothetical protein HYT17_03700 [Candidatus Microgenomates bacterium]|nr:hypothetical protein [Candidatus Microgenomates bacterium]
MSREQILSDFRAGVIDPVDPSYALFWREKLDIKSAGYDILQAMEVMADDGNLNEFKPIKRVGIFVVTVGYPRFGWPDPEPGFHLSPDDKVIWLGLPPLRPEEKRLSQIEKSFADLAKYIRICPTSKCVMAVTYNKLARVALRFGFTVAEIQLQEDLAGHLESVYSGFVKRGLLRGKTGSPMLCYQRTEDFLARYQ